VISLPSGVFKPYAGVSTAIIIFAKGGNTENVFFYDVQSDGFTLDDKRAKIGDGKGDLPDVQAKYLQWCEGNGDFSDQTAKAFEVSAGDIRAQSYDLSVNRYRQQAHTAEKHLDPREVLAQLKALEKDIQNELAELEELLG
jgi:type I restriction enzyme M protein